jgi:hypothetical protein
MTGLSVMASGMRREWVAVMANEVRQSRTAPVVAMDRRTSFAMTNRGRLMQSRPCRLSTAYPPRPGAISLRHCERSAAIHAPAFAPMDPRLRGDDAGFLKDGRRCEKRLRSCFLSKKGVLRIPCGH